MRENNTAVTKTPMTEYIVDGDKIYPKPAPPSLANTPAATKPANRPTDPGKLSSPGKDNQEG